MDICRKDACDALRIVGWQRGEGQTVLCEKFDHIANPCAASHSYLTVCWIF
jgi:hypothetical protein